LNPHAQLLWGQALINAGKKHGDLSLIQKGWVHVSEAREQIREQQRAVGRAEVAPLS
jgi:hypothetical protein